MVRWPVQLLVDLASIIGTFAVVFVARTPDLFHHMSANICNYNWVEPYISISTQIKRLKKIKICIAYDFE
jgi:hypothetical protein